MFSQPSPDTVASDEGWLVKRLGRFAIQYGEGERSMTVDCEQLTAPCTGRATVGDGRARPRQFQRRLGGRLRFLGPELKTRGANELGDIVEAATRNASALSREILGESRLALRQVRDEMQLVLSSQEKADLLDVLRQLDQALDRR